ncbi:unnamed protein product [Vicia faba]|uniref:Uncharacterized protein n=1 Tax=Vicia faba TaxID=3906 RepID=A0AAV0Z024_VICFA|nr:unnamed protein product [Vicia faba]
MNQNIKQNRSITEPGRCRFEVDGGLTAKFRGFVYQRQLRGARRQICGVVSGGGDRASVDLRVWISDGGVDADLGGWTVIVLDFAFESFPGFLNDNKKLFDDGVV